MEYSGGIKTSELSQNFFSQKTQIRLNPIKVRESTLVRKPLKPFSSSLIKQRKIIPTREEILKINSKLQLIKSKVMKNHPINRNDSRRTLSSQWISNEQLNESLDIESQDDVLTKTNTQAHLIKSPYLYRPPTIFFYYPKCCGINQPPNERVYPLQKSDLCYKIYGSEYKCIVNSLEYNGFRKCEGGSEWNILFDISGTHNKVLENMNRYQKINHFPGCWNIGRKDNMWRNLNKMRRIHPQAFNFVPLTYLFPTDYQRFEIIRENAEKHQLWIMKPSNAACGRGIKMVTKQTKIANKKDYQVSEYIANPHLINNFHRIYSFLFIISSQS